MAVRLLLRSDRMRQRLLYIALLGVVTTALSLLALYRALTLSEALRIERGRDALSGELGRLARLQPSAEALAGPQATTYVGLRGGWLDDATGAAKLEAVPAAWRPLLTDTVAAAASSHARVITEHALPPSRLLLAAEPAEHGFAWTGYLVQPSAYLKPWRQIVFGLAAATALLVATAFLGALSFRRNAASLHATLVALGKDLTTKVPEPKAGELTGIADGIRRMAADLTASRDATERLQRELAQKERLAALGRVAAGVAHEVRNPLASIKLRLDLSAATHALPPAAKEAVEAASQEIVRLDRLVGDLLLVAGKKMGPRRAVELGSLLRARWEALAPWAATRGVAVHIDGAGVADADHESVARALDNLLRNAVEASPQGGRVEARVIDGAQAIELQVEDRGGGVEPARESELFEPFFTTKPEGTGLGLAISRAIARAHGGELTYTRDGAVTRFQLTLPRHAGSSEAAA
jgi:signal transduction histidine kinase